MKFIPNRIFYFLFTGVILLSSCASQTSPTASTSKPNVIFILADDLGYGDLGVYGQEKISTPNIDAIARNGMKFTQFYAGTTVCAPSRSALMTGQHTGHTPIRGNKETQPEGQHPLEASAYTIAELFKDAGYVTGDFGKWGLGFVGTEGDPNKQGFDRFYGYNCQRLAHDYFPDHLWENSKRINLPNTLTNPEVYAPDLIQEKTLQFITDNKDKPFFAFLSMTLPHAGLELPAGDKLFEDYKKKFKEQPLDVKEVKTEPSLYMGQKYPRAAYAAMVTRMDNYVGQVMDRLKELNIDKNTLIIFSSDNGPHVEGGNDPDFFNSRAGFKGNKRDLYEGGIRVPMLMSWPGVIKRGVVSDRIAAFWDFMPTFAELTGKNAPANIDGKSILPVLKGQNAPEHEYLYWEFHEGGGRQAVRIGNWKGVRLNAIANPNGPIELYDLQKDKGEANNIAAAHPDMVKRMENAMREAHVESPVFPFFTKVRAK